MDSPMPENNTSMFRKFLSFGAGAREHEKTARRYTISNPYHAVQITPPPGNGCKAVQDCGAKRFLSSEAPTLPLPGCDAAQCKCRYVHRDDRRAGPRRAADVAISHLRVWPGNERRRGGRRITDR
jgi:hypothetical protein